MGALDLRDILRTRERRGGGLAGRAGTADGLEEVLKPAGGQHPGHLQLVRALVDDAVPGAGPEIEHGARGDRVRLSIDLDAPGSGKEEQQFRLAPMRMFAHMTAGRDGLHPRGEPADAGTVARRNLDLRIAVRRHGLPEAAPGIGPADHHRAARVPVHRRFPLIAAAHGGATGEPGQRPPARPMAASASPQGRVMRRSSETLATAAPRGRLRTPGFRCSCPTGRGGFRRSRPSMRGRRPGRWSPA